MLAGTPGAELRCPPELIEVTDAGVPLICPPEAGTSARRNPQARIAATVAEFSPFTYESYPSLETMAQPPQQ
jgi:hypothetical protein